jgi:AbrB family looped-hinge helix DNA binding protein
MLMKVHNKGQVVIPCRVRRLLHIEIGDFVDIDLGTRKATLKMTKPRSNQSARLAGVFSQNKRHRKVFPNRAQMHEALAQGLADEK